MPSLDTDFERILRTRASVGRRLRRRLAASSPPAPPLDALKLEALDFAHRRLGLRSAADLGAVWAVDAGYSFHLADLPGVESVIAVDDDFTPTATRAAERRDNVRLLRGNFGDATVAAQVGKVDAIVMFDVLLHQVSPDWDEVLGLYAENTRAFVLAGPWYTDGGTSVRLLDLGEERYLATVPGQDTHEGLFARLDEINPRRGRPWRDVHDIWQWGITDDDLRRCMRLLGFTLAHFENRGAWRSLPCFDNSAYVFARPELMAGVP
ncbi:MAG TPA: class I SAM-dependent methyltransferase [Solirubrobacteraceae bacterium]